MNLKIDASDQLLLNQIAQAIYDKKGRNILALDVRGISSLTDYFLIAEGNSEKHVTSLAKAVSDMGKRPYYIEGLQTGDWVVMDYGSVIAHLFHPDLREKYELESLWQNAKIVDLNIVTGKQDET